MDVNTLLLIVNPMILVLIGGVTLNLPITSVKTRENPQVNSLHPVLLKRSSMNVNLLKIVVPQIPVRFKNVSNQTPKLLLTVKSQKLFVNQVTIVPVVFVHLVRGVQKPIELVTIITPVLGTFATLMS